MPVLLRKNCIEATQLEDCCSFMTFINYPRDAREISAEPAGRAAPTSSEREAPTAAAEFEKESDGGIRRAENSPPAPD